jgi:arsenic resistance protein ArsH
MPSFLQDRSFPFPSPSSSFSRLTAYEASRILHRLGVDVRVYDPSGMPLKDGTSERSPKVVELRQLSEWSDAQVWVSPEQHGTVTAVMKNQSAFLASAAAFVTGSVERRLTTIPI